MVYQTNGAFQIMSTQISGSTITEGGRPKPRTLGMFLITGLAGILGILFASQVVNRWLAFEVEEGPDGSSVALLSPFGMFPLRNTPGGNKSLLFFAYPDSARQEQAWLDWTAGPGTPATSRRQLALLTYRTGASLTQLDSWYQKKLGSFARSKSWPVAEKEESSTWMHRVESGVRPEGITFHQDLSHRSRGVLLLPGPGGQGSQIKLYDYMETSGQ